MVKYNKERNSGMAKKAHKEMLCYMRNFFQLLETG